MYTIIFFAFTFASLAEENKVISSRYDDDSYAWKADKVFFSHGYYTVDNTTTQRDLWPIHYDIYCADRLNGYVELLVKNIQADVVQLFVHREELYIVFYDNHSYVVGSGYWASDITNSWYSSCHVLLYNAADKNIKLSYDIAFHEYIRDASIYSGRLYVITDNGIYCCYNNDTYAIHKFDGKSLNSIYENHMVFDDDILYFQEDDYVCSIDINTGNVKRETAIDDIYSKSYRDDKTDEYILKNYNHIVVNGLIYYCDEQNGITMAYDTDSKGTFIASYKEYHFLSFTDGIIKAGCIERDSEMNYIVYDCLLSIDENGKLSEQIGRDEDGRLVGNTSIPIGNDQYTLPIDVDINKVSVIDILRC